MRQRAALDLATFVEPAQAFVLDLIGQRVAGSAPCSTIGFSGDGFHGRLTIGFDTLEHSAEHLRTFGEAGNGRDSAGAFCLNTFDFAVVHQSEFELPGFPDLYEAKTALVRTMAGTVVDLVEEVSMSGDEGAHAVLFPWVRAVAGPLFPFEGLSRSNPFRAVVQMDEGYCTSESWCHRAGARPEVMWFREDGRSGPGPDREY